MSPGFAPAKINLFLHVGPLGPDGYHPLHSWMVFADVGDEVAVEEGDLTFRLTGPFPRGVPADASNLVIRARDAFLAVQPLPPFGLVLDKRLPPASGIGGGSSDAAAVLRLLQERAPIAQDRLAEIALSLGADVPACLKAKLVNVAGRGEQLSSAVEIPPLPAVLVNPGVGVSTREVFEVFDRGNPGPLGYWRVERDFRSVAEFIAELGAMTGNDLQPAAQELAPVIGEVLEALEADDRCRLARMSGSGATCFALCETTADAQSLARDLTAARPRWWVRATILR